MRETIAAISTALGGGGIAIVRISGPRAWEIGRAVFLPKGGWKDDEPTTRKMAFGHVVDPGTGETADEAMAVFFGAPHTYSTEDTVELQCHGGPAVAQGVLELCVKQGARLAQAGEFTRRAFEGGRLSLDQAEAVAAMVAAQSRNEARLAQLSLRGGLARELESVRRELTQAAAAVEAAVDFPDEVEDLDWAGIGHGLAQAGSNLQRLVERSKETTAFRQGVQVVICGRPNVGKSSLFNALLSRERAIVTSTPGTTRDAIEESVVLGGVTCRLMDTAGINIEAIDVEAMGVALARRKAEEAEVLLLVLDRSEGLRQEDRDLLASTSGRRRVVAVNKVDLAGAWDKERSGLGMDEAIEVSAVTGQGVQAVGEALGRAAVGGAREPSPGEAVANQRQAEALRRCLAASQRAAGGIEAGEDMEPELVSLDLAEALTALGEVDGQGAPNEVIDAVFANFCVGK